MFAAFDTPRFEFRVDRAKLMLGLVFAGTMAVAGLGMFPIALLVDFPEPVLNKRVALILFGIIWIALALALFVNNWRNMGQRLLIYADGFVLRKAGSYLECQWDEVAVLWLDSSTYGSVAMAKTNLTLDTKDGRKILLSEWFVGMPALVDVVLGETSKRMVPLALAELKEGESLEFGDLSVNSQRLAYGDHRLLWSQAAPVEVARGFVNIRRKEDGQSWYSITVKRMPNYHVFLAVAAEMLRKNEVDEA